MRARDFWMSILVSPLLLVSACGDSGKVVTVTDTRDGKTLSVRCRDVFRTSGNPPTTSVKPLDPAVTGAILSSFDDFVAKATSEGGKASLLLPSLYESLQRGNLALVAQKILYYECFGEVLPLG